MDLIIKELKKDIEELTEMLEELLKEYISMKNATDYHNELDQSYVARFLKAIKAKRRWL